MSGDPRLVRGGRGGASVHLATCPYVKRGKFVFWLWAEGRDDDEWLAKGWFKPCRVCLPEQARRLAEAKAAAGGPEGGKR